MAQIIFSATAQLAATERFASELRSRIAKAGGNISQKPEAGVSMTPMSVSASKLQGALGVGWSWLFRVS